MHEPLASAGTISAAPILQEDESPSAPPGLAAYAAVFRTRWPAVLLGCVCGLLVAVAVTATTPTTYEARARVFINIPAAQGIQEALQGVQLSAQLMASYRELVESRPAAEAIAADVGPPLNSADVEEMLQATIDGPSLLISIRSTAETPDLAASIANAGAEELRSIIAELEEGRTNAVEGRVVEQAIPPSAPVAPRPLRNLAFGFGVGLAGGVLIALAWHGLDRSVRSLDLIEQLAAAPALADVPRAREVSRGDVFEVKSGAAEAYRSLRTSMRFAALGVPVRSVVVTSPGVGEGKSTTAANLALAYARADDNVVLLDLDLRRPTLHERFLLPLSPGLGDLLAGDATLDEVLHEVHPHARVLTAGTIPMNPAELLGSASTRRLLDELTRSADVVIIDSPPALAVTDAAILATMADAVLLVVQWGRTSRTAITDATRRLRSVGATVLGCVLNKDRHERLTGEYYRKDPRARPEAVKLTARLRTPPDEP